MIPIPDIETTPEYPVSNPQVGWSQFMRNSLEFGARESIMGSFARIQEFNRSATGRLLTPEEANDLYGEDGLNFNKPIHENQAQLLRERKRHENRMKRIMSSGSTGFARTVGGFAGVMAGSLSNPLDIGIGFVPVVGTAGKGAQITGTGVRATAARIWARGGLIPAEALSRVPIAARFPNTAAAVIEGTVGQAIAEIPTAIANFQDKSDYTLGDAALNIAGAGILSGGLRAMLSGAARMISHMHEESFRAANKLAEAQLIEGRNRIDVSSIVETDPGVVAHKMKVAERLSKYEDIEMSRNYLTREAMEEIDRITPKLRREAIAADPARQINRDDLIALAYAELKGAVDRGEQLAPDVVVLQRSLYDFEKNRKGLVKERRKKSNKGPRAEVAAKVAEAKLDEIADLFGLKYNTEARVKPQSFDSLADRKQFFSVAKHLDPSVRGDIVAANTRRMLEQAGDSDLHKRVGLEKLRRGWQAMEDIDRRLRQEAELEEIQIREGIQRETAPTKSERKYLDVKESEKMLAAIQEDIEQLKVLAGEGFEPEDAGYLYEAANVAAGCATL